MTPPIDITQLVIEALEATGRPCGSCNAEARVRHDKDTPLVSMLSIAHDPTCSVLKAHFGRPNRAQRRAAARGWRWTR